MRFIDTHSHLYDAAFDTDRDEVLERCRQAGVDKIILPGIDPDTYGKLLALSDNYPGVFLPAIGLHPTSVNDDPHYLRDLDTTVSIIQDRYEAAAICAIGEIGLDLYWSKDYFTEQLHVFTQQLDMACRMGLPVIIHTRDAWPEMIAVLQQYKGKELRGVMHSFSGTLEDYRRVRECGDFVFGAGGVITYKNCSYDWLGHIPLTEMVLETDAPYLSPVPYRGKRNESSYIQLIAAKLAEIYSEDVDTIARITTRNACKMFRIAER